mmetsp:Transcript_98271/g.204965  ORF Transcript_98271/g.204965 Transcript_98271/m.204965 type:complete len:95 (+) Transcript_98271:914-1198(+)
MLGHLSWSLSLSMVLELSRRAGSGCLVAAEPVLGRQPQKEVPKMSSPSADSGIGTVAASRSLAALYCGVARQTEGGCTMRQQQPCYEARVNEDS